MQSFPVVLTFFLRKADVELRNTLFNLFAAVEGRIILANDPLRAIAGNGLRPLVPADNGTGGIEHDNGMVLYTVHQQAESMFAGLERLTDPKVGEIPAIQQQGIIADKSPRKNDEAGHKDSGGELDA